MARAESDPGTAGRICPAGDECKGIDSLSQLQCSRTAPDSAYQDSDYQLSDRVDTFTDNVVVVRYESRFLAHF